MQSFKRETAGLVFMIKVAWLLSIYHRGQRFGNPAVDPPTSVSFSRKEANRNKHNDMIECYKSELTWRDITEHGGKDRELALK